jgi:peptidoglycan/xylan/chitin deacetylase (PgdA/CDA1 family)
LKAWVDLESKYGYRSTFFAAAHVGRPHHLDPFYYLDDTVYWGHQELPLWQALKRLEKGGWEVGLHGSYQSYLDPERLRQEREYLSQKLGRSVEGVRQHYLRLETPETWRSQSQAGFLYDSTLGFNEMPGFRAGIGLPFQPFGLERRERLDFLELPLVAMDSAVLGQATQNLTIDQATDRCIGILNKVAETNGLVVLSWHTNVLDQTHWPGWLEVYERILSYLQTRNVWVAPAGEIAAWWRKRTESLKLVREI